MKLYLTFILLSITLITNAQDYKLEGNEVKITKPILFETNTDKLKPESADALQIIKQYLIDKKYISLLRIECHTSNDGNANQSLSEKRALAVYKKLIEMGIDCKRLIPVGFGSTKPIADNNLPEGKAQNNRVSFINAALMGHFIGGMPADGGGKVAGDVCQ